jgi:hypothetical protein
MVVSILFMVDYFFIIFYLQVVVAGSIFCIVVDVNVGTLCAVFHLTN